ncbi:uncharacterized protein LOC134192642 [Corticium candelabrum]|uniref:uncharacterized protein LOC134192642 n=1 Tax=Corticium candelabrum TaxID=121492 RepID=UPI002E26EC0B|nr:uncharacterized protein LOC134192642 [Corticium candelabrum]
MILVGLFACAIVLVQETLSSETCSSYNLFKLKTCRELNSTSNCYNICGGRQTSIQNTNVCLDRPSLVFSVGDVIRSAIWTNLDRPLDAPLNYYVRFNFTGERLTVLAGEICTEFPEYCHTTKIFWNNSITVPKKLSYYAGLIKGEGRLSDKDGLFLCLNFSITLRK